MTIDNLKIENSKYSFMARTTDQKNNNLMEKIVSLCKRRGFIFPSSEIYGGFAGVYDYGPRGVELKNNIKEQWRKAMKQGEQEITEIDSGIIMHPKVWEASGHTSAGFSDPLRECKSCHKRWRADHLEEERCPECGGKLTEIKNFNLLVETHLGPVKDDSTLAYLRGETAQGIYMHYKDVREIRQMKVPFGIAQIGKAFRNEITPRHFIYRTREFEQMEMQFFINPSEQNKWFDYWKKQRMQWYINLGVKKGNLRFRNHAQDELAHYAKAACDIEYKFPFGWSEIEGIHNRGEWDLSNHSKMSGEDLSYFDPDTKDKYTPYIIETSAGLDRATLVFLLNAYKEVKGGRTTTTKSIKEVETVLQLHNSLTPFKIAVLPLLRKPELTKMAKEIQNKLRKQYVCDYDETQSIGKRYRRQDEIGTPYCITIDFNSLKNKDATVRDRDTMEQERVKIEELEKYFENKLNS